MSLRVKDSFFRLLQPPCLPRDKNPTTPLFNLSTPSTSISWDISTVNFWDLSSMLLLDLVQGDCYWGKLSALHFIWPRPITLPALPLLSLRMSGNLFYSRCFPLGIIEGIHIFPRSWLSYIAFNIITHLIYCLSLSVSQPNREAVEESPKAF